MSVEKLRFSGLRVIVNASKVGPEPVLEGVYLQQVAFNCFERHYEVDISGDISTTINIRQFHAFF
jgi:hypothetical protein